ncbi:MAG: hypothetical protein G01um101425_285 [Candidatus Peregrinibacteria bacterium Gr01-1014_25]|nr:MAG: hypothetical protein G01um101425_285 [Candidatus Peregrinibacteria bacterium Gr01-1014_25]
MQNGGTDMSIAKSHRVRQSKIHARERRHDRREGAEELRLLTTLTLVGVEEPHLLLEDRKIHVPRPSASSPQDGS